ncbi:ImmA/IrrE family metallo-endopeptidase [Paeniglutamicibacter terrestris]|uniref:ImmA/IrrE family metallo-endopeptidase n=1 Tax=Paeniglutamicibacter terrestris TaxID=2723403 RepID=A0ABX1G879_9MICC|nr:ImmA/IrrE family metallo-endopeptidase [Paeniglutamicibacter terrestris]
MLALLELAERRGIRVLYGHLDGRNGVYYHELGMIILDQGLCESTERFTLAHELGHAHYGHLDSSPANEMKADEYAARLLISHERYAQAESLGDSHNFIAQELGLPLRAIEAYCRGLVRK